MIGSAPTRRHQRRSRLGTAVMTVVAVVGVGLVPWPFSGHGDL